MPGERVPASGPRIIRPLLGVPRATIAAHAAEQALSWIEDESNADRRHRRNHLRHAVLPCIAQQFPAAAQSLARAAGHFAEAAQLLDELAAIDRSLVAGAAGRIDLQRFNRLSAARARNLLRHELHGAGFRAPEARWLDEALRQLATVGGGSQTCIGTVDGELHVYRGELYIIRQRASVPAVPLAWRGEPELPWGAGRVSFAATVGAGISAACWPRCASLFADEARAASAAARPEAAAPRPAQAVAGSRRAALGARASATAVLRRTGGLGGWTRRRRRRLPVPRVELLWERGDGQAPAGFALPGKRLPALVRRPADRAAAQRLPASSCASSTAVRTPIFSKRLARCTSTVRMLICSSSAMTLLSLPARTSSMTCARASSGGPGKR
jgi:hypothetical protein